MNSDILLEISKYSTYKTIINLSLLSKNIHDVFSRYILPNIGYKYILEVKSQTRFYWWYPDDIMRIVCIYKYPDTSPDLLIFKKIAHVYELKLFFKGDQYLPSDIKHSPTAKLKTKHRYFDCKKSKINYHF